MSDSLTLTAAEIFEVTGTKRRSKQLEWFAARGIPATLNNRNVVSVNRSAYHAKTMPAGSRTRAKTEPRLDLLKHGQAA